MGLIFCFLFSIFIFYFLFSGLNCNFGAAQTHLGREVLQEDDDFGELQGLQLAGEAEEDRRAHVHLSHVQPFSLSRSIYRSVFFVRAEADAGGGSGVAGPERRGSRERTRTACLPRTWHRGAEREAPVRERYGER